MTAELAVPNHRWYTKPRHVELPKTYATKTTLLSAGIALIDGGTGVETSYPVWVQPVGAVDAYPGGARVTYHGQEWESVGLAANVLSPDIFGWRLL